MLALLHINHFHYQAVSHLTSKDIITLLKNSPIKIFSQSPSHETFFRLNGFELKIFKGEFSRIMVIQMIKTTVVSTP